MEQLQEFFKQLPQDIQQKILSLSPEEQKAVLTQMINEVSSNQQQFEYGGETQMVPIEAERNENITVQSGQTPDIYNGNIEQQSFNPVSGQSTYEIPMDNPSHNQGGVKMVVEAGDVINSDKTKIKNDYKIYGKNFKGKTFKEASDFISKKENDIQKTLLKLNKAKQSDSTTEESAELMLGKLAMERNNLNELQEITLEQNKQLEGNKLLESYKKEYGGYIKDINKYDRILNTKNISKKQFIKAENVINTTAKKIKNFTDKLSNNKGMSNQEVFQNMNSIIQGSQLPNSTKVSMNPYPEPIFNKSNVIGSFKEKIASEESRGYTNPYIAIAGLNEKDVEGKTYEQVKHLAASSGVGKYQIIWNIHKSNIKKITGIDSIEDFRNNPQAQETFMDWFIQNDLLPGATELKQKYQLPYTIEQIMAGVHLEGKAGLEKKIKSNTLNTSTMAKNFKNATSNQYMNSFESGGYIYAEGGHSPSKRTSPNYFNQQNWDYLNQQAQQYMGRSFNTVEEFQNWAKTTYPSLYAEMFNEYEGNKPLWSMTNQGKNNKIKSPITEQNLPSVFNDGNFVYRGFIPHDKSFDSQEEYDQFIEGRRKSGDYFLYQEPNSPLPYTWVKPYLKTANNDTTPEIIKKEDEIIIKKEDDTVSEEKISAIPNPTDPPPSSSILDKLKYAARESLPYLDNLRLMREGRIMPTLQQKPYQNPYDNMVTDINIQSNLNDIDRSTLTAMAQSTGNPSVRNARMAQLMSNITNAKNQLYSQKYNQENQLQNQKNIGQIQYLNQWEDVNRDLRKRYETEMLQTIENQRQQKHFAINKMMNDYLRKQEQNNARDLALLETNYDWNPYTQKYEFNKEKADANFAYKKMTHSPSKSKNNNIVKLDDGEEYYRNNKGDLIKISSYSN